MVYLTASTLGALLQIDGRNVDGGAIEFPSGARLLIDAIVEGSADGALLDEIAEAVAAAKAAAAEAQEIVVGEVDPTIAALVGNPASDTGAALSATIAAAVADIEVGTGVDRVVTATVASGTYTADLAVGDIFVLNLTGNATLAVTGLVAGRSFVVEVQQDATGGRVLTLPTAIGPAVTLATTAGTFETLVYYSLDGTNLRVRKAGAGGGSGPAPAWTPSVLTDQIAWFNGDTLTSGAAISSWANSFTSGVAGPAAQATGTQQPVAATVNGVKVADFDGVNDVLSTAAFTAEPFPFTYAALIVSDVTTSARVAVGGNTTNEGWIGLASSVIRAAGSGGSLIASAAAPSTTAYQTVVCVFNGASSKLRVDGVEVTGTITAASVTTLRLGADGAAGGSPWNGRIAEVIAVGHASDSTEIGHIEAWLNAKKTDLAS